MKNVSKGKDMSQPNHLSALKITDDIQIGKLKKETEMGSMQASKPRTNKERAFGR